MPVSTLKEGAGRADRLFRLVAPELPRVLVRSLFAGGRVRANGHRIKAGDSLIGPVEFQWELLLPSDPMVVPVDIEIVHDAGAWFAVNKPSGLHTSKLRERGGISLEDWLESFDPALAEIEEHGLVNRLDQETSGVVMCARDRETRSRLRDKIGHADKTYWTAVIGDPPETGRIGFELRTASRRSETVSRFGKRAQRTGETWYKVAGRKRGYAKLEVKLIGPGARHQIRAHLAGEGFPVAGDPLYGGVRSDGPERLALHAWKLKVPGERHEIVAAVPSELLDWWDR